MSADLIRTCSNQKDIVIIRPVNGGPDHKEFVCNSKVDHVGSSGKTPDGQQIIFCGKLPFLVSGCRAYCPLVSEPAEETPV